MGCRLHYVTFLSGIRIVQGDLGVGWLVAHVCSTVRRLLFMYYCIIFCRGSSLDLSFRRASVESFSKVTVLSLVPSTSVESQLCCDSTKIKDIRKEIERVTRQKIIYLPKLSRWAAGSVSRSFFFDNSSCLNMRNQP
jgi:hypothetical protein